MESKKQLKEKDRELEETKRKLVEKARKLEDNFLLSCLSFYQPLVPIFAFLSLLFDLIFSFF